MLVPEFWYGRSLSEVGDFMVWSARAFLGKTLTKLISPLPGDIILWWFPEDLALEGKNKTELDLLPAAGSTGSCSPPGLPQLLGLTMGCVMRHPESFWATHQSAACRRLPDSSHSLTRRCQTKLDLFSGSSPILAHRCVRSTCRRRSPKKWTRVPDPRRSARTPRRPRYGSGLPAKVEFPFGVEYQ
jgi:hypothetical protein